jgi:hypothetical protein
MLEAEKRYKLLLRLNVSESRCSICGRGFSHLTTTLGAAAADLGTGVQLGVVNSHALAVSATSITYIRTDTADAPVYLGLSDHKVGTRLTDIGAVEQQTDVFNLCVGTTQF